VVVDTLCRNGTHVERVAIAAHPGFVWPTSWAKALVGKAMAFQFDERRGIVGQGPWLRTFASTSV